MGIASALTRIGSPNGKSHGIPFRERVRRGSISQGRKEGLPRSEGRSYLVKIGVVIHFLVKV